jgi:hypothetical protein
MMAIRFSLKLAQEPPAFRGASPVPGDDGAEHDVRPQARLLPK